MLSYLTFACFDEQKGLWTCCYIFDIMLHSLMGISYLGVHSYVYINIMYLYSITNYRSFWLFCSVYLGA
jgi:hypothetical protein